MNEEQVCPSCKQKEKAAYIRQHVLAEVSCVASEVTEPPMYEPWLLRFRLGQALVDVELEPGRITVLDGVSKSASHFDSVEGATACVVGLLKDHSPFNTRRL